MFKSLKNWFSKDYSKVSLIVDASFAFDYLSILMVKMNNKGGKQNIDNYFFCFENLLNEMDSNLFYDILESKEFQDLYISNLKVFRLVDLAKNDLCYASEVDKMNYQRYIVKQTLQQKFFGSSVSEVKIGY